MARPKRPGGNAAPPPAALPSYTVVMTPFQLWLRTECMKRGWSEHELARQAGVASSTAHGWWWARMVPTPIFEERLAEATGTELSYIRNLVWESRRVKVTQRAMLRAAGLAPERGMGYAKPPPRTTPSASNSEPAPSASNSKHTPKGFRSRTVPPSSVPKQTPSSSKSKPTPRSGSRSPDVSQSGRANQVELLRIDKTVGVCSLLADSATPVPEVNDAAA